MSIIRRFKTQRNFRKFEKFYENPASEELWDFHYSFLKFMIPRLEKFKIESSEIVDWHWHLENDKIDVPGTIDSIVDDFKFIEENMYCFDEKIAKECIKRNKRAFRNLGKIFFYLWS